MEDKENLAQKDFDLCNTCCQKEGHNHKMDNFVMDLDDGFSADSQENPQESLCQAFQAMLTMNQIQGTVPPVQQGVQRMPIHQPQVANAMNMQPPHSAGQVQHSQALQQLLQTLKSPNSPQQQQEVISVLKPYPKVMTAFMKYRIQLKLKEQQLQQQLQQQQQLNPVIQMPSMQQQPHDQPQYFIAQQEMLWQQRLQQMQHQQQHHQNPALQMHSMQQQPQQQPQGCCVGLSEFQAHGSVSQAQNFGQDMSLLQ